MNLNVNLSSKSQLLIPNVARPYIYGILKVGCLTEMPHVCITVTMAAANTRTGDVIPNATSLVTAKFIQLVCRQCTETSYGGY